MQHRQGKKVTATKEGRERDVKIYFSVLTLGCKFETYDFKMTMSSTYKLIASIIITFTVVVQGCGHRTAFLPDRHVFLDASGRLAPLFGHYQSIQHSKEEFPQEILCIRLW